MFSVINKRLNDFEVIRKFKEVLKFKVYYGSVHRKFVQNNKRIVQFYGIRRRGNHVLIEWFSPTAKERVFFCNDIETDR